jgi:predicted RNase H-like HicB family nuclease
VKFVNRYVALVRKEPTSDFGVDFPDFPGCVTAGSTLDEARSMAEEALSFHIEGMLEDGDSLPEPTPIESILEDPDNQDVATVFLVAPKTALLETA